MNSTALIVNGKSRRGQEWYEQAKLALEEAGFKLEIAELVRDPKNMDRLVKSAIDKKIPLVCVGGGDGTLSMVAPHFIGSDSVLGVFPLGTGNSLARELGIPADVKTACQAITDGTAKSIDLGEVNGQVFVNVATIGLTTRIAESLDSTAKKRFGRLVYIGAIFRALVTLRSFEVTLAIGEERHKFKSVQVVVGSGRFHGGPFPILPDASIRNGKLAGYVVKGTTRLSLLRFAFRLLRGSHADLPEVFPFEVDSLELQTVPSRRITIDGEIKLKTPAKFKSLPAVLRVMVPKNADLDPGTA